VVSTGLSLKESYKYYGVEAFNLRQKINKTKDLHLRKHNNK
jgi:hypothetical protein